MIKEKIQEAVDKTLSISQAADSLGMNRNKFIYYANKYEIILKRNMSGKGISKKRKARKKLSDILDGKFPDFSTNHLKWRLIEEGIKENKCEICGIDEWNGKPIICQLDHINGNPKDHRLDNLQIICPNCHSQTDTYCGRNINRAIAPKRTFYDYNDELKKINDEKNEDVIKKLLSSTIDFSKFGWVGEAAIIVGISPQKISKWMLRNLPDFYNEKCFRRKM